MFGCDVYPAGYPFVNKGDAKACSDPAAMGWAPSFSSGSSSSAHVRTCRAHAGGVAWRALCFCCSSHASKGSREPEHFSSSPPRALSVRARCVRADVLPTVLIGIVAISFDEATRHAANMQEILRKMRTVVVDTEVLVYEACGRRLSLAAGRM